MDLALGLARNLAAFKRIVPHAQNYADLGLDPYGPGFASRLLGIMQMAEHICFDLSGMGFLNTRDGVLNGPASLNPPGSTNWELRTTWDDPALRAKTTFYRDGHELAERDVLRLH